MSCQPRTACFAAFTRRLPTTSGLEIWVLGLPFNPSMPALLYSDEGAVGADPSDTLGMPESHSRGTAADKSTRAPGQTYDRSLPLFGFAGPL